MCTIDELTEKINRLICEAYPDDEPTDDYSHYIDNLSDEEYEDFVETVDDLFHAYMEEPEHVLQIKNPDYVHTIGNDLCDSIYEPLLDAELCTETDYDDIHEYIIEHLNDWIKRQEPHVEDESADTDIARLSDIPQPEQRTPEWYEFRHNHLTASNLWKAFSTDAQYNSLIYEKCQPPRIYGTMSNTDSPLHWGVKYEPLTRMLYEHKNRVSVADFGCIEHETVKCLAASPDGIVVTKGPLYGRMVEIKNIVNRVIDGVPSEAYWIQMQLQMECCKLDLCDFVETRFKEYSAEEYADDEEHDIRGFFIQKSDGSYEYMPTDLWDKTDAEKEAWKTSYTDAIVTIYYYLDEYSCITVRRNPLWFLAATARIMETWDTILKERVDGYEHRAPKRRTSTLSSTLTVIKLDE